MENDVWLGGIVVRRLVTALVAAMMVVALGGCRDSPKPSPPDSAEVRLDTPAGPTNARIYGARSGRGIVVVADDAETSAWAQVATELGQAGYQVIVLPRPERDAAATVRVASDHLSQRGATQVVFIGSGRGATAALEAAAGGASGVGVLNPAGAASGIPAGGVPPVALLVMASLRDGPSSAAAQELYRAAREPRRLALYPAVEPAPAAFAGESNEVKMALFDFLRAAFQPLAA